MAENNANTPQKGKRRWGKAVLIVSLALNLVVVGLVVGAFFSGHERGSQRPLGVRNYVAAMTKVQRREFLKTSEHGMLDHLKVIKTLNRGQSGILDAIEAEPFDPQALMAAMQDQRDQLSLVTGGFHMELAKALTVMSQQERKIFVKRYKKHGQHRWGKRRRN